MLVFLFGGCLSDSGETAGGGDDFPNTIGPVLAKGLSDWSDERTLRPDQEGADTTAMAVLAKQASVDATELLMTLASTTYDLSDTGHGRVSVYSLDTAVLRITADTLVLAWNAAALDTVKDNESVYYIASRTTKRASGATQYRRFSPLDSLLRAPNLDSSRIRMHMERDNWRSCILEGRGNLMETLDMDFVYFPDDTLSNYPRSYQETLENDSRTLKTALLSEDGDSILVPGENLIMRRMLFVSGDSSELQEIGIEPGTEPWHGSARYSSFHVIQYRPSQSGWSRVEILYNGDRGYAEDESLTSGSFHLELVRTDGHWALDGTFDAEAFSGTLKGPNGSSRGFHYGR